MKISKRVREEAALICAIAASTPDFGCAYGAVIRALGWKRGAAFDLAIAAWGKAGSHWLLELSRQSHDAEAEALLRTGWSP